MWHDRVSIPKKILFNNYNLPYKLLVKKKRKEKFGQERENSTTNFDARESSTSSAVKRALDEQKKQVKG